MRIPILMYHSILNDHNLSISIKSFKKQMYLMKKIGYETINLNELKIKDSKKKFVITFDDGYENIFLNAYPILKELGFTATCFLIPNKIGQHNDWDQINKDYKKMNLMSHKQINELLNSGFEVGSHTLEHLDLTLLNKKNKIKQIIESKNKLENFFNINVKSFSFPYGHYDNEIINLLSDDYQFAVTTKPSIFDSNKFKYLEMPRVSINSNTSLFKFLIKVLSNYENYKFNK